MTPKKVKWSVDDKPIKVDKWDGTAVKNSLDDAVKKVLTDKYHYKENHALIDGRLAICTLAVAIAMVALAWDYFHPFPQSRPVLIFCVLAYFFLMGILTLYTSFKEKGIFLVAINRDPTGVDPDEKWQISSHIKRFDDTYHLILEYSGKGSQAAREAKLEKSVATWFDENGVLIFDSFQQEVSKLHDSLLADKKDK